MSFLLLQRHPLASAILSEDIHYCLLLILDTNGHQTKLWIRVNCGFHIHLQHEISYCVEWKFKETNIEFLVAFPSTLTISCSHLKPTHIFEGRFYQQCQSREPEKFPTIETLRTYVNTCSVSLKSDVMSRFQ
jgi:hypothetical protein